MKRKLMWLIYMAELILLVSATVALAEVEINGINFPDETFREYVSENFDMNSDGVLNNEEIGIVDTIDASYKSISSMKGIEYFTALKYLDVTKNTLTTLDISKNTKLEILFCKDNCIANLSIGTNNYLSDLICNGNQLSSIDIRGVPNLEILDCKNNKLANLNLSMNKGLEQLYCYGNRLTELDLTNCYLLKKMVAQKEPQINSDGIRSWIISNWGNQKRDHNVVYRYYSTGACLETDSDVNIIYDVTYEENKIAIDEMHFPDSAFRGLIEKFDKDKDGFLSDSEISAIIVIDKKISADFQHNAKNLDGIEYLTALEELYIGYCNFTSLNLGNCKSLKILHCYNNELTSLDVSGCTGLEELNCDTNPLKSLNLKNNKQLKILICGNTYIDTLDLSNNTKLKIVFCEQWCYGWWELSQINIRNCPELNRVLNTKDFNNINTDFFPNQLVYSHKMHGWFTDTNGDGRFDNNVDIGLFVSDKTKIIKDSEDTISVDISETVISTIKDQEYTGKAIKPGVSVKYKKIKLKKGTDYSVSYQNNKAVGEAKVIITGKGNYSGTKETTFKIIPKKPSIKDVESGKKKLKIKWTKVNGAQGYEIEYNLRKNFTSAGNAITAAGSKKSLTIKGLKAERRYYLRIRSWKKVKGIIYYSDWSETVSEVIGE